MYFKSPFSGYHMLYNENDEQIAVIDYISFVIASSSRPARRYKCEKLPHIKPCSLKKCKELVLAHFEKEA